MPTRHRFEGLGDFGIDKQHVGLAVIDDVADFDGRQTKVDRHEHPAIARHAPKTLEQTGRIVRHHGYSGTEADPERIQRGPHGACSLVELAKRH